MTKPILALIAVVALTLAACDQRGAETSVAGQAPVETTPPSPAQSQTEEFPMVEAPAPGTPGGLPDDRTPISEAPFTPQSAQGAADVVQTYFAHIGQKDYAAAYGLLRNPSQSLVQFTQGFAKYHQYSANVGAPGAVEGAAGSSFVETPVLIYGRLKTGEVVNELGKATLRRVNDVPGSTPEQRLWRIEKIETKPTEADGVANG